MGQTYSTSEVAAAISVDKSTLLRWLYTGKLKEPLKQTFGGVTSRIWSEKDLANARKHREERYRRRP
jgi:predicted site-specific integrase-resolvase